MTEDSSSKRMAELRKIIELTKTTPSYIWFETVPLGMWFGIAYYEDKKARIQYGVGETDISVIPETLTIKGDVCLATLARYEAHGGDVESILIVDLEDKRIYGKGWPITSGSEEIREMGYKTIDINRKELPEEIKKKLKVTMNYNVIDISAVL